MATFKKTKEEKIGTAGKFDVVRETYKESKGGPLKVRMMPPVVLTPKK